MSTKKVSTKDYDGDGVKESPEEEYKGSKDKKIKANMKRKKKKNLRESKDITGFITAISSKKYALAHKYLKQVIEDKISKRIESSLNKPLF